MTPDALFRATEIHLRYPPKDWPAAIVREPAEHQATIREYFVGIAARIRVVRSARVLGDTRVSRGHKERP